MSQRAVSQKVVKETLCLVDLPQCSRCLEDSAQPKSLVHVHSRNKAALASVGTDTNGTGKNLSSVAIAWDQ